MPILQSMPVEPCTAMDFFSERKGEQKMGGKVASPFYCHYPHIRDNRNSYGSFQETLFTMHPEVALAIAASRRKVQWGLTSAVLIATSNNFCMSCYEWLKGFEAMEGIQIRVCPWGGERKVGWLVPGEGWGLVDSVKASNTRVRDLLEDKARKVINKWKKGGIDSLSSAERHELRQAQQDARRERFGVPRRPG
ncbi:hypothetical protein TWF506_002527 [Arthrobotrys conoides]|uniref:Uncharacterized protein n=1 Tax=Arthrobotrys conoides TaxID=74498 RepID=A0AAN8RT10_9PEZI